MTDKLYFDNLLIAEIANTEADFPNFTGQFTLHIKAEDELTTHLMNYINFSQRQNDFYLSEDFESEELEEKLLEEENTFDDLINSNSWHIIDHTGQKTRIMHPTFDFQNTLLWRFNTDH